MIIKRVNRKTNLNICSWCLHYTQADEVIDLENITNVWYKDIQSG